MVFDPVANELVKEREHLHKILTSELWVFGEQYNQMLTERGLTAALDRHLEILGEGRTDKSVGPPPRRHRWGGSTFYCRRRPPSTTGTGIWLWS